MKKTGRVNGDYKSLVDSIESMSDSFIILDRNFNLKYSNHNAEKLLGYKKEQLIGKSLFKFFPKVKKTPFYTQAKKSLKTNKPIKFDTYSMEFNKWLEVRLYPLPSAISFYFTDISVRKKAEFRQEFISKINSAIALSLDYNTALQKAAKVIVDFLADDCRIVLFDEDEKIKEIKVNRSKSTKVNFETKVYENYKDMEDAHYDISQIIKHGKTQIIPRVDNKSTKNLKIKASIKSYIGMPLIARGEIIGAITLSYTKNNRAYGRDELALIGGVASRIALSLDNMRLYERAKKEHEWLEYGQRVGEIGTFEWDMKNNKSTWTKEFTSLFGNPANEFEGTMDKWLTFVHLDDQKTVIEESQKAIKNGNDLYLEFRVVWPDNSTHYLSAKAQIQRDTKGQPIKMNGVILDITKRKIMENDLRFLAETGKVLSSSLDYKSTISNIAKISVPQMADWCAINMLDKNGKIERIAIEHKDPKKVEWAKKLYKEYPPDINAKTGTPNVLRTGISEIYPIITKEFIEKSVKGKKQLNIIKKIGLYSLMIVPIINRDKAIGTITFATTEESKRSYTQEDLITVEKLANRIALVIENANLYQKSQQAIKLREAFISIASHELKTPITSLKVYTQVLRQQAEEQKNENLSHYLIKMDQQVEKLNKLIKDLLDASRMQLGKLTFRKEYFDLDKLAQEVVEAIQLTTKNHNIVVSGSAGKVFGDKDRIGQVFINLIINAIKYSPDADKVVVNLGQLKGRVIVNVQDFGIGIDKENREKIFERFFQVDNSSESSLAGLGVGLYVSTEIIKRHGGNIWVETEKGKGSIFSFALPATNGQLPS